MSFESKLRALEYKDTLTEEEQGQEVPRLTRREFLRLSAAAALGAIAAACKGAETDTLGIPQITLTPEQALKVIEKGAELLEKLETPTITPRPSVEEVEKVERVEEVEAEITEAPKIEESTVISTVEPPPYFADYS